MSAPGLTTLGFVGFVALGLPEGATGVAWPSIAVDLDQEIGRLGVLLVALVVGYFLASALTGLTTRRLGIGRTLVASSVISAVGLLGLAAAPVWPVMLAMVVVLGVGTALVDAALNAHTALHGGPRLMHLLHASFGIGATVGPLIMTLFLVGPGSWRSGFAVFGVVQLGLAAAFLRTRDRWEVAHPSAPPRGGARFTGAVVTSLVLFAVYTGLEVAAGQWAYSVLTEDRGVGDGAAGVWVAAYWASITIGRLMAGLLDDRIGPSRLVVVGSATALVGALVFWAGPEVSLGSGGVGLVLVGFGLAPVFPSMVLLTPERVGPERSTAVVGYQLAAASVGAALLPGLVGVLVDTVGLDAVAPALIAFAVAMGLAIAATWWMPDASSRPRAPAG